MLKHQNVDSHRMAPAGAAGAWFSGRMAARTGQLLSLNAVAQDLGISQTTARDWLAVLDASYIAWRLPPYHTNFGKRLVKTPTL